MCRRGFEGGNERFHEFGTGVAAVETARGVGHEQDAPGVGRGFGEVPVAAHAYEVAAVTVEVQDGAHLTGCGEMAQQVKTDRGRDNPAGKAVGAPGGRAVTSDMSQSFPLGSVLSGPGDHDTR